MKKPKFHAMIWLLCLLAVAGCSEDECPTCPSSTDPKGMSMQFAVRITHVTDANNLLGGAVEIGDVLFGTCAYDTAAVDTCTSFYYSCYPIDTAPYGIYIEHNGIVFASDPDDLFFTLMVADNFNEFYIYEDYLFFRSYNNLMVISEDETLEIQLLLKGDTTPLSSTEIPHPLPDLDEWTSTYLRIAQSCAEGTFEFSGEIIVFSQP